MSIIYSSTGARCYCVVWASATNAAAWLRHRTDYCPFLLERREPYGVHSPCGHRCMVCATVCLTVMPSFSVIIDGSTIKSVTVSRPTEVAPPYFTSRCTETTLYAENKISENYPVGKHAKSCHYHIRTLHHICPSITEDVSEMITCSAVTWNKQILCLSVLRPRFYTN